MFYLITGALSITLYFILTLPVLIALALFRKKYPFKVQHIAQLFIRYGFRVILFCCGGKLICIGADKVPKDKAVMFASNHRGIMEAAMGYATVPVDTSFVAKKEIKKVPFLAQWMLMSKCFFLDRDNPRSGVTMLLTSIQNIKGGVSMFICPEGTRSKTADMLPFKEPSFKIATKSGCPIVPVACSGADDIFENHKPWFKHTTLVIEYGDPIFPDDLTEEDLETVGAYTQKKVKDMLATHEQYLTKNYSRKHPDRVFLTEK